MRILFTFVGTHGHFEPLVPVACAADLAGHSVAFGCPPMMVATVEAAGFRAFAIGTSAGKPPQRTPLRPLDSEREDRDLRDRFARRAARYRVPLIAELCKQWRPDMLVCDETDFGALIAAECLSLPFANILVTAAGSFVRNEVVGEALNQLRRAHALPADPDLDMLSRYLVLSPFPPSFRDPAYPLPETAHSFHSSMPQAVGNPSPTWSSALPDKPTVYLTLGTVFTLESGDLLWRLVLGLGTLPVNLVVTVGHDLDPAEFGPQPSNVHIASYIPQSSVLPRCDLVVSHGGSGSVIGALSHGLPSVLIPIGADQPLNAGRCSVLGVAAVLDAVEVTAESVRAAVSMVLDVPGYRLNAERLRDEIEALPGPPYAVALLERLAEEKQPLYSI